MCLCVFHQTQFVFSWNADCQDSYIVHYFHSFHLYVKGWFVDASLGLSVVPVQYLEDGLEIGWSAVEAADAYELSVVTDNDYFTLHRTIPASGETQYRVHLDRSELAGHGPYMVTVNATAQGEVTQRSRDVFVTMQVARELDDALRASSQELSSYPEA